MSGSAFSIVRKMKKGYTAILEKEGKSPAKVPDVRIVGGPSGAKTVQYIPYIPPSQPSEKPVPETKNKKIIRGVEIAVDTDAAAVVPPKRQQEGNELKGVDMSYPLIPREPGPGEKVFASVNIKWNQRAGGVIYSVIEPELSQLDIAAIQKTKKILEEKLDIDFFKVGEIRAKSLLRDEIHKILRLNPSLDPWKIDSIRYYLERAVSYTHLTLPTNREV